ncbi:MAG: glycoside hydrolase [Flavobacteriaceae bacterium]|nr:glycoside hydrolase [Flavobacteriaceae bacterium]
MTALRIKIGQSFMPAAFIHDSEDHMSYLEELIRDYHIGGLCFFHSRQSAAANKADQKSNEFEHKNELQLLREKIEHFQSISKTPLFISIDAEWGLAMRVRNLKLFPYATALGTLNDLKYIEQTGYLCGKECAELGIHINFAPVVDVNSNPNNPVIGFRSFGNDPDHISLQAEAFMNGMRAGGVLPCLKHFPGHGDTDLDSHHHLPVIQKSLADFEASDWIPYRKLITENTEAVMIAHLLATSIDHQNPSSLSKKTIDLLQTSLGFKGTVFSDALNMKALKINNTKTNAQLCFEAYEAGCDFLCFAEDIPEAINLISKCDQELINSRYQSVQRLKEKHSALKNKKELPTYNIDDYHAQIASKLITIIDGEYNWKPESNTTFSLKYFGEVPEYFERELKKAHKLEGASSKKILCIQPPQLRPAGNFGFDQTEIEDINKQIQQSLHCIIIFGNPYFIQKLRNIEDVTVLCTFLGQKDYQIACANHFIHPQTLGKFNF